MQLRPKQLFQQQLGRAAAADVHKDIPRPQRPALQVTRDCIGRFGARQLCQKRIQCFCVRRLEVENAFRLTFRADSAAVRGKLRAGQPLARQRRQHARILTRHQKRRGQTAAGNLQILCLFLGVKQAVDLPHQIHIPREEIKPCGRACSPPVMQPVTKRHGKRPQH